MASTTMTYSILTGAKSTEGSIKWFVGHESIYAASALAEAELMVYERLRIREMVQSAAVSAVSGDSTISLDTLAPRFLQPIRLKIDGMGKLPYKREEDFPDDRNEDGDLEVGPTPSCWTVLGTTIQFDIELNAALSGTFWYYGGLAPLAVTTNETNVLTDRYPSLFRHAILSRAYAHRNRDDMMTNEMLLFEKALRDANASNDDMRYGQDQ